MKHRNSMSLGWVSKGLRVEGNVNLSESFQFSRSVLRRE